MSQEAKTIVQLTDEVTHLRTRLGEAEDTLRAIRIGEVDAVLVQGPQGDQLFTLKGADEPYRVLIEEMNQGAVTLSHDGLTLYCNRRFGDLLKAPPEEIIGLPFAHFVASTEKVQFGALLQASLNEAGAGEITLEAKDGSVVPLQLALSPLPEKSVAAICLVATDISESRDKETSLHRSMADLVRAEKEAEMARSEAERANAAKGEFLANMSHEIRTPMNGIIGMTDLALETDLDRDRREYLGMVKSSAHALLALINNILDFSKIEAGKLELEQVNFSLQECVTNALKPLGLRASQKGVALEIELPSTAPDHLLGDPLRLRQILINLTDNAIKFTEEGSIQVKVVPGATAGETQCFRFSVKDTGAGIPEEKQELIFEAFAQVDGSTTRNYGGTGLGLSIASQLVEQMGGKIWIKSTLGEGTTFHFTAWFGVLPALPLRSLPLPEKPTADLPASLKDQENGAPLGLRILLAEDNAVNRTLASRMLDKRGHSIVHAASGREALELARTDAFDLIFMDVQMPEMDGYEATQQIRQTELAEGRRRTPIVAMTARAMSGDRERCLAAGMDDYLSKPLEKAVLLDLIERTAATPRPVTDLPPAALPTVPLPEEVAPREVIPAGGFAAPLCLHIARSASWLAIALGLFALVGWVFSLHPVTTMLPDSLSMKVNTALAFCFGGLSLLSFTYRPVSGKSVRLEQLSTGAAGLVAAIGALTLCQYFYDVDLKIDELFFHDPAEIMAPGRMAPISAFNFFSLGLALLLLRFPKRINWAHALNAAVALTSLLVICGYFYGVTSLYQLGQFSAVALPTAIAFLALCVGFCFATHGYGFMKLVADPETSGILFRRHGLSAFILPFIIGWLCLGAQRLGWFGPELGLAIFAMASAVTFALLIWIGASSLRISERNRGLAEEKVRRAHMDLEIRVDQRTSELAQAIAGLQQQNQERVRAQKALQAILDNSVDVICTFDSEGRFLQVNRACEGLWGYLPEELIGKPFLPMVHPEDREKTVNVDQSILGGVSASDFENRYLRKDGSIVPILWTAHWSEALQINVCVARDMTSRKMMESDLRGAKEAAEAASRAKSEFVANMSHEIRTPMNGIIGMTELVLEMELSREQREYLGLARSSAQALLRLMNDILDFSKLEGGIIELEVVRFSLRDCLNTLLKPLAIRAEEKGIELTAEIPAIVPDEVIGDPLRLRQILINLLDNAIKFTERGDVMLRVSLETAVGDEHWLHFAVSDTGIGIPFEKQKLIFEAFSQADGSTTRTYGGTGLGLAIASQLVRQMGGQIWVKSIFGEGAAFHFTARLAVRQIAVTDDRQVDFHRLEGLRVLVMDDNAVNRRILREMFAQWGMQPTLVASGAAALLEMLRSSHAGNPFPLAVLDGTMPEMDGFTVAAKFREYPDLEVAMVMMLPAALPSEMTSRCAELGVGAFVTKPVTQAQMASAIFTTLTETLGEESAVEMTPPEPRVARLNILLAEDNVVNRALAVAILKKCGHSVVLAANGREASEAAAREAFDLIFMDIQMPEMDGFAATRLIRETEKASGRHTPIVAMTAHAMTGDRERCLAGGMDDYLSKPLNKAKLVELLQRITISRESASPVIPSPILNGHLPSAGLSLVPSETLPAETGNNS